MMMLKLIPWSFISMGIRYLFLFKSLFFLEDKGPVFQSLFFLEDKGPVFESFNKTFGKIEKCYNGNRNKTNHLTSPVGTLVIAYLIQLFQKNFPNFSCSLFPLKIIRFMIQQVTQSVVLSSKWHVLSFISVSQGGITSLW